MPFWMDTLNICVVPPCRRGRTHQVSPTPRWDRFPHPFTLQRPTFPHYPTTTPPPPPYHHHHTHTPTHHPPPRTRRALPLPRALLFYVELAALHTRPTLVDTAVRWKDCRPTDIYHDDLPLPPCTADAGNLLGCLYPDSRQTGIH